MKKLTVLIAVFLIMADVSFALPNPAAVYCKNLGYTYNIIKSSAGESGECIFSATEKCDEWNFLEGKCGESYSYCVRNGYDLKTVSDGKGKYSYDYAVCVPKIPYQTQRAVTDFITLNNDVNVSANTTQNYTTQASTSTVSSASLPSYFDWRNVSGSNWMTPVKDQDGCGSCWDFAAIGAIEAKIKIENNSPSINPDLSEQDILSCSGIGGCGGGVPVIVLWYAKGTGVVDEACFPYTATDYLTNPCSNRCSDWPSRLTKIAGYLGVPSDTTMAKQYLIYKGPFITIMAMDGGFDSHGIYTCGTSNPLQDHAVVVVGYNDTGGYWIIRNSWGSSWNGDGYFKMYYGNCSISLQNYIYAFRKNIPPNNVTNLAAINPTKTSITLQWASVTDNIPPSWLNESVSYYRIAVSTSPAINEGNFESLAGSSYVVGNDPPGTVRNAIVGLLSLNTTYYFAVKSYDIFGNPSNVSNIASATTASGILLFNDSVEGGNMGWVVSGNNGSGGPALWHITTHRSTSPTHSVYYGKEGAWNYYNGFSNNGYFISPVINITNYSVLYLTLNYYADLNPGDNFSITEYVDGHPLNIFSFNTSIGNASTYAFVDKILQLTDGDKTLQVSFNFNTSNISSNTHEGVYIDDIEIIASNHKPIANAGGPYVNGTGLTIAFNGSSSYDADGDISYWWWQFGDVNGWNQPTSLHDYSEPGIYNVTLNVTDSQGAWSVSNTTATVHFASPIPTTLNFSVTPPSGSAYSQVTPVFACNYGRAGDWVVRNAIVNFTIDSAVYPATYSMMTGDYRYSGVTLNAGTHTWSCNASKFGYQSQTGPTQTYIVNPYPTTLTQKSFPSSPQTVNDSKFKVQVGFVADYNATFQNKSYCVVNATVKLYVDGVQYSTLYGAFPAYGCYVYPYPINLSVGTHTWYFTASATNFTSQTGPTQTYIVKQSTRGGSPLLIKTMEAPMEKLPTENNTWTLAVVLIALVGIGIGYFIMKGIMTSTVSRKTKKK